MKLFCLKCIYKYTKRYNSFSTDAMAAKASKSDYELVNALFVVVSGKITDAQRVTMRLCDISTGRVLQLIVQVGNPKCGNLRCYCGIAG